MNARKWIILQKRYLDTYRRVGESEQFAIAHVYGRSKAEAERNARIVSAAPDLLEALDRAHLQIIQLLDEGDFKRLVELDLGYIVDAIEKAGGVK